MAPKIPEAELGALWRRAGRPGAQKLQEVVRREGLRIVAADARAFLATQAVAQVFRQPQRVGGTISASQKNSRWQVDLLEQTSRTSARNGGFDFALVAVDVFSRRIGAEPMKGKGAAEAWRAFQAVAARLGGPPKVVETDVGGEFEGAFERGLGERGAMHIQKDPRSRNALALVDSAIGRLRAAMGKELVETAGVSWVEALPRAVSALNSRPMDSLYGAAPDDVETDDSTSLLVTVNRGQEMLHNARASEAFVDKLRAAGRYRVLLPKRQWQKGAEKPRYSGEVYTVASIDGGVITNTEGGKHRAAWATPVGAESRDVATPAALGQGDAAKEHGRREALGPFVEALKVKLRATGEPMTLQAVGNFLAKIPGYTDAMRRLKVDGFKALAALYPETLQLRSDGREQRVSLRPLRRVAEKRAVR